MAASAFAGCRAYREAGISRTASRTEQCVLRAAQCAPTSERGRDAAVDHHERVDHLPDPGARELARSGAALEDPLGSVHPCLRVLVVARVEGAEQPVPENQLVREVARVVTRF